MRTSFMTGVVAAGLAAALTASAVQAETVADFYQGKTVSIVIGASMGGSYGMYSQLVARHLPRHIPGNPAMIVQARPGAGGVVALNYMHNVAPRDGTVMSMVASAVVFETVLNEKAQFDANAFQYLGRLVSTDMIGVVSRASGITSLEDLKSRNAVFGGSGARNGLSISAQLVRQVADVNIRVITGYPGVGPITQAVEAGEIDGMSTTVVSPQYLQFIDRYRKGEQTDLIPIYSATLERTADLPDVPSLGDMNPSQDMIGFVNVFVSQGIVGRSLAFPAGVPEDRVAAFRAGFEAMLKDEEFRADVAKASIPLDPMTGPQLQERVAAIIAANPPEKVAATRAVYENIIETLSKMAK